MLPLHRLPPLDDPILAYCKKWGFRPDPPFSLPFEQVHVEPITSVLEEIREKHKLEEIRERQERKRKKIIQEKAELLRSADDAELKGDGFTAAYLRYQAKKMES